MRKNVNEKFQNRELGTSMSSLKCQGFQRHNAARIVSSSIQTIEV